MNLTWTALLILILIPLSQTLPLCEDFCRDMCSALNGNVRHECGACSAELACHPGAPDWPARPTISEAKRVLGLETVSLEGRRRSLERKHEHFEQRSMVNRELPYVPRSWINLSLCFAIIGFPKCGTTSLRTNLQLVTAIAMPEYELPLADEPHAMKWSPRVSSLLYGGANASRKVGVLHPSIIYSIHDLARLVAVRPAISVVVCTREVLGWLDSFYNYRVAEWRRSPHTGLWDRRFRTWGFFEAYPKLALRRYFGQSGPPPGMAFIAAGGNWLGVSLEHARQTVYIERARVIFGESNVLVFPLERVALHRTARAAYRLLLRFLGVAGHAGDSAAVFNVANRPSNRNIVVNRTQFDFVCASQAVRAAVVDALHSENLDEEACLHRAQMHSCYMRKSGLARIGRVPWSGVADDLSPETAICSK